MKLSPEERAQRERDVIEGNRRAKARALAAARDYRRRADAMWGDMSPREINRLMRGVKVAVPV